MHSAVKIKHKVILEVLIHTLASGHALTNALISIKDYGCVNVDVKKLLYFQVKEWISDQQEKARVLESFRLKH